MRFEVEIKGKEEFEKTLKELVKALPPEKVEPVFMEGAKTIADDAKSKAPKGPTGNLKRSIKAKFLKQIGNNPKSAAAVSDRKIAPHGHLVEYGTAPRKQKSGRSTGFVSAHPFWRPAVDSNIGKIYENVKNKLIDMVIKKFEAK